MKKTVLALSLLGSMLWNHATYTSIVPWVDDAHSCATDDDDMIRQQVMLWGTAGLGAVVAIGYLWNRFSPSQRVLHTSIELDTEALISQLNDKAYGEYILLTKLIVRALNLCHERSLDFTLNDTRDGKIHINIQIPRQKIVFEGVFEHLTIQDIDRIRINFQRNKGLPYLKVTLDLPLTAPLTLESLDRLLEQACREHR